MKLLYSITALFYRIRNRQLRLGAGARLDPRMFIARGGPVNIGSHSIVRAGALLLPSGGSIEIGKNTSINQYVVINGHGRVIIGDWVMIGAFTSIFAANHIFENPGVPIRTQGLKSEGIIIEDDVWLGTHSVILDGVKVGRGSVIAAGAVVNKDVPPFTIVAGVPAKVVGSRKKSEEE